MTAPKSRPTLEKFAEKIIEEYLFHDLRKMGAVRAFGNSYGGLTFPMLGACFAGIELLGGLTSKSQFSTSRSKRHFTDYWTDCLAKVDPCYDPSRINPSAIYELARSGIAHQFLTKPGVGVNKGRNRSHHMVITGGTEWRLLISARLLADDLQESYRRFVEPVIRDGGPAREAMQQRLTEMLDIYETQIPPAISMGRPPQYFG